MSTTETGQRPAGKLDLLEGHNLHPKFVNLLKLLNQLRQNPEDVLNTPRSKLIAYARKNLPSIWFVWAVIILVYFRGRTRAVWEIGRLMREAFIDRVLDVGCELEREGRLTDITEWKYCINARATILEHRVTGERIAVGAIFDTCDTLDSMELLEALENDGDHSPAYERGRTLFRSIDGINGAFEVMERYGVLSREGWSHLTLHPILIIHQDEVDALINQLREFPERWDQIAAALGDAPYLAESNPSNEIRRLADECQEEWQGVLHAEAARELTPNLVHALADAHCLDPFVASALSNEATAEAAVVYAKGDPQWCDPVWTVFQNSERCWWNCADYLVQHNHNTDDVLKDLATQEGHYDHAVKLSLAHAPHLTPAFLRDGLRSSNESHRETAAVVLALIDRPQCWDALANVLSESDDWEVTAEARNLLRASSNPTLQALVDNWENEHQDSRPGYDRSGASLAKTISEWTDKVVPARDQIPDPTT